MAQRCPFFLGRLLKGNQEESHRFVLFLFLFCVCVCVCLGDFSRENQDGSHRVLLFSPLFVCVSFLRLPVLVGGVGKRNTQPQVQPKKRQSHIGLVCSLVSNLSCLVLGLWKLSPFRSAHFWPHTRKLK